MTTCSPGCMMWHPGFQLDNYSIGLVSTLNNSILNLKTLLKNRLKNHYQEIKLEKFTTDLLSRPSGKISCDRYLRQTEFWKRHIWTKISFAFNFSGEHLVFIIKKNCLIKTAE